MARAIHWTLTFKSLNNTDCTVNIYDNDYSGNPVALTGAANPFFFEETEDDDLISAVVRYRTGYINLIEHSEGELTDLYPQADQDRYVEMFYGYTLMFSGYIQVQAFGNPWTAYPRQVSLPIVSPVGITDRMHFNRVYPPTCKTLGALLDEVISGLGAIYQYVYLPQITDIDFSLQLFSLVVSPWNDDYHHSINSASPDVFIKPRSYAYFLNGLCSAFGWMLHDTPSALIFSMFDHKGLYVQYPVGHIGDPNYKTVVPSPTDTVFPLTNWFTYSDNQAKEGLILPCDAIDIGFDGKLEDGVRISFDRTAFSSVTGYALTPKTSVANLVPITNEIQVSGGNVIFDADHYAAPGVYAVALGSDEGVLIALDPSTPSDTTLFKMRYYTKTAGRSWIMEYRAQIGDFIANLSDDDAIKNNIHTNLTVAADYIEVEFKLFYNNTYPFPTNKLIFITAVELQLVVNNELYSDYRIRPTDSSEMIPADAGGDARAGVDMPFSLYREGTNLIGTSVRAAKLTTYPYMFKPRNKIMATFKGTIPSMYPCQMYSFWRTGWIWRIVSLGFYPWDDLFALTLQRSETLETSTT